MVVDSAHALAIASAVTIRRIMVVFIAAMRPMQPLLAMRSQQLHNFEAASSSGRQSHAVRLMTSARSAETTSTRSSH